MAFIQKDKHSRKDVLNPGAAGDGPEKEVPKHGRVLIHTHNDGSTHVHMQLPGDNGPVANPHLDGLLKRLEENRESEKKSS